MTLRSSIVVGFMGVLAVAGCGSDGDSDRMAKGSTGGQSGTVSVSDDVAKDLQFLREEEKLARDVYLELYDKWQLTQHQSISNSEQTHMDRVEGTLASFGIEDPVQDESVRGGFVNATLGKLYSDLTSEGAESEVAALRVGAIIEDLDIRDIEEMKGRTDLANVLTMYAALQCGSRNHLRTYTSQLASRGESYTPQYLTQADFDAILAAPNEKCGK